MAKIRNAAPNANGMWKGRAMTADVLNDPRHRLAPVDPDDLTQGYVGYKQDAWSKLGDVMNYAIPALMAAPYVAAGAGALTGGGAASTTTMIPGTGIPTVAGAGSTGIVAPTVASAGTTAATTGAATTGAKALAGKFSGRDMTDLALAALSLFGDDQERESFEGAGEADPRRALHQALSGLYRSGQGLAERSPVRLRSSYVPSAGPEPVSIPGLPFQIGGGLGVDPALRDPSLLEGTGRTGGFQTYDPFQSVAQGQFDEAGKKPRGR